MVWFVAVAKKSKVCAVFLHRKMYNTFTLMILLINLPRFLAACCTCSVLPLLLQHFRLQFLFLMSLFQVVWQLWNVVVSEFRNLVAMQIILGYSISISHNLSWYGWDLIVEYSLRNVSFLIPTYVTTKINKNLPTFWCYWMIRRIIGLSIAQRISTFEASTK